MSPMTPMSSEANQLTMYKIHRTQKSYTIRAHQLGVVRRSRLPFKSKSDDFEQSLIIIILDDRQILFRTRNSLFFLLLIDSHFSLTHIYFWMKKKSFCLWIKKKKKYRNFSRHFEEMRMILTEIIRSNDRENARVCGNAIVIFFYQIKRSTDDKKINKSHGWHKHNTRQNKNNIKIFVWHLNGSLV